MRIFSCALTLLSASLAIGLAADSEIGPKYCLREIIKSDERIRSHGYPSESHTIDTSDGYELTVFRIPYSHKLQNQEIYRPVVLLQHGLLSNSDCWLCSGPDNSLAYLLSDAGYDVWLGNARGNIYSRKNTNISIYNPKFWHFDWHEIGTIDIASMIDYIIEKTGQKAIHYVGHSQGTTTYLVLMSERMEYNDKIKSAHLLGPCAFFEHGSHPVFGLLGSLVGTPGGVWNQLFVDAEMIPHNDLFNRIVDNSCGERGIYNPICKNGFFLFANGGYQNINMTAAQLLIETHPAGSSTNQGIHYLQLWESHEFRQYDWGPKRNLHLYGQDMPPNYNLSKITAPTHLYSGKKDALCGPKDVNTLVSKFTHLIEDYRIPDNEFNHVDFIVAHNIKKELNDIVMDRLRQYEDKCI